MISYSIEPQFVITIFTKKFSDIEILRDMAENEFIKYTLGSGQGKIELPHCDEDWGIKYEDKEGWIHQIKLYGVHVSFLPYIKKLIKELGG